MFEPAGVFPSACRPDVLSKTFSPKTSKNRSLAEVNYQKKPAPSLAISHPDRFLQEFAQPKLRSPSSEKDPQFSQPPLHPLYRHRARDKPTAPRAESVPS